MTLAFALGGGLAGMPAFAQPAVMGPDSSHSQARAGSPELARPILFDLPSQPLHQTLALFDSTANLSVFFESDLTFGKMSAPVMGSFTAPEALRQLLLGTGLVARTVAPGAFVLAPDASPPAPGDRGRDAVDHGTSGHLQVSVYQALCKALDARLGQHRLALSILFRADGRVKTARLLDSTGSEARDAAVLAAVRGVRLDTPPADPSRPFVILVRAREPGAPSACPLAAGVPP